MRTVDCDCLILCGGLGTRLQSVVGESQKVMADVDGVPFLDHLINHIKGQGVERIILCTGYKADSVEKYYRDHDFGMTIDFSRENEPLGTGGAVKNAHEIVSSNPFFVLNGDSLISADFQRFLNFHMLKEALASILTTKVDRADDFGSIGVNASDEIEYFNEKKKTEAPVFVNAGIYCFNEEVFSLMPEGRFSLETEFFPGLVGNRLFACQTDQAFLDIGTPQRYNSAQQEINKGKTIGN